MLRLSTWCMSEGQGSSGRREGVGQWIHGWREVGGGIWGERFREAIRRRHNLMEGEARLCQARREEGCGGLWNGDFILRAGFPEGQRAVTGTLGDGYIRHGANQLVSGESTSSCDHRRCGPGLEEKRKADLVHGGCVH